MSVQIPILYFWNIDNKISIITTKVVHFENKILIKFLNTFLLNILYANDMKFFQILPITEGCSYYIEARPKINKKMFGSHEL